MVVSLGGDFPVPAGPRGGGRVRPPLPSGQAASAWRQIIKGGFFKEPGLPDEEDPFFGATNSRAVELLIKRPLVDFGMYN